MASTRRRRLAIRLASRLLLALLGTSTNVAVAAPTVAAAHELPVPLNLVELPAQTLAAGSASLSITVDAHAAAGRKFAATAPHNVTVLQEAKPAKGGARYLQRAKSGLAVASGGHATITRDLAIGPSSATAPLVVDVTLYECAATAPDTARPGEACIIKTYRTAIARVVGAATHLAIAITPAASAPAPVTIAATPRAATAAAAAPAAPASDGALRFTSGDERVALIELFTSQGCSSCPPAEEWMRRLDHDAGLWRRFVPVAYHVDYWDQLGWPDVFAQPRFTQRQRAYGALWGSGTIYTPGLVRDGEEWREWGEGPLAGRAREASPGRLEVAWNAAASTADLTYRAAASEAPPTRAVIARLGLDLVTEVQAGENAGRTLHQSFVVLAQSEGAWQRGDGSTWTAHLRLPAASQAAPHQALAAWAVADGRPVQAAGATLP